MVHTPQTRAWVGFRNAPGGEAYLDSYATNERVANVSEPCSNELHDYRQDIVIMYARPDRKREEEGPEKCASLPVTC